MKIGVVCGNEFIQEIIKFMVDNLKMKKNNALTVNDLLLKFEINKLRIFLILPGSEVFKFVSTETLRDMDDKTIENINEIRELVNCRINKNKSN